MWLVNWLTEKYIFVIVQVKQTQIDSILEGSEGL